jgi:Baseplate J-like protein
VNADTLYLIERPYQEVVDDIVTSIVGGVVNEPIIFDLKEDLYPLAKRAIDVRGITGSVREEGKFVPHTFQKLVDYAFSGPDNAIIWQKSKDAIWPADETVFYVDYFQPAGASRSPLSDINVGSVTRTLSEAIGREISTVYQQINAAYLTGFVDTATGQSLDFVVSILGIKRKTGEFAAGLVTFFRDPAAGDGNITIPEGVGLTTKNGKISFVTVELRTLQRGQARIDVPVRATTAGPEGNAASGTITTLSQPILGIGSVTNFEATVQAAAAETDDQLRARAKSVLRGAGKATIAALTNAIGGQSAKLLEVSDPNGPPGKRQPPGTVALSIETEPEHFPSVRGAVEETRAAGVLTLLVARYIFFRPRIRVGLKMPVAAAGESKLKAEIIAAMQTSVDKLTAGDPATGEELLKAIGTVKEVDIKKTKIVDVIAQKSDLGHGPESLLGIVLKTVKDVLAPTNATAPASPPAIPEEALKNALTAALFTAPSTVPNFPRKTDRSLVQGPSGQPATDAEIEAGTFEVSATLDGEKGWVVLDASEDDLRFESA